MSGPDALTFSKRRRCTCLGAGAVAIALAMPGAALAYSLQALLQMPLERLLELKVVPRRAAQIAPPSAVTAQGPRSSGGPRHAE